MRNLFFIAVFLMYTNMLIVGQNNIVKNRLQVSKDGHYLQYTNGTPFFWLGDAAWELFHRLNLDEIRLYLDNRKSKGFTVILAVILAENDGLRIPNQYGQLPLIDLDPTKPNEKYFNVVDSTIRMAYDRNMFVGILPTWGDKVAQFWGTGPVVFDSVNAYSYGKWLGNRYKNETNIIWILGGDRPAVKDSSDWRPIWRAMANGILDGTDNNAIITYHPTGDNVSTSKFLHNEHWLNINMFQSGHGAGHDVPCWETVWNDFNMEPAKPTLDGEPNYEDHPVNPWPKWDTDNGYYRDYDVRKQCYRSVFAGACGVTYGHHAVWQFMNAKVEAINYPDRGWVNALDRPGAFQVGYLRKLIESQQMLKRVPDNSLILTPQGDKHEFMVACRASDYSYAMVYIPQGKNIILDLSKFSKTIAVIWFNPVNGNVQSKQIIKNKPNIVFEPPTYGNGNDWVLIIENK
jgi:hypothetical protein